MSTLEYRTAIDPSLCVGRVSSGDHRAKATDPKEIPRAEKIRINSYQALHLQKALDLLRYTLPLLFWEIKCKFDHSGLQCMYICVCIYIYIYIYIYIHIHNMHNFSIIGTWSTTIIVWLPAKFLGFIHKDFRNHHANYSLNEIYN